MSEMSNPERSTALLGFAISDLVIFIGAPPAAPPYTPRPLPPAPPSPTSPDSPPVETNFLVIIIIACTVMYEGFMPSAALSPAPSLVPGLGRGAWVGCQNKAAAELLGRTSTTLAIFCHRCVVMMLVVIGVLAGCYVRKKKREKNLAMLKEHRAKYSASKKTSNPAFAGRTKTSQVGPLAT